MASILVLGKGDSRRSDWARATFAQTAISSGHDVQASDYHEIKNLGKFRNARINVALFFPYTFWNENCELPNDRRLYGANSHSYGLFRSFLSGIRGELEQKFPGCTLSFVNPPEGAAIDRDKIETVNTLRARGVMVPQQIESRSVDGILGAISDGSGVFIKCRFGSEGKGITVLHKGKWVTNYRVGQDGLANHGIYGAWPFSDITGRRELLEQLVQQEVIVEREIIPPGFYTGKKFDLRVFVVNGEAPHLLARLNDSEKEITNYSQGGAILHHPETGIPEAILLKARQIAVVAAEALGLRFAGVDIMFDKAMDNPVVVEEQAFSAFPALEKFNLADYMLNRSGLFK
jgi:glutathione synthase/RimK-type ligase-like ATP-grasp enzyme